MKRQYIPIIGTISAGKSTFLKSFLGINMLQTGSSTTTKFVCLIKHSNNNCFYHVLPKNENKIEFIKEGEEITDEEQIKIKIENINKDLSERKGTKNDIFYMLETPIKNIKNEKLLENCYFMDIPGLNENNSTYIQDIFSLITINDILFEIMIFDSTSIGSDNILDIFKELDKKNCLKKENNLYILNKIDQCSKLGEENIIDSFKNYFYQEFEDEKIVDKSKIKINFSENYFIPMNSLLYQAESTIDEDFYSFLIFELFKFLEYNDKTECSSFFEYIQKRNEVLISRNNNKIEKIEKIAKKIKDNDKEMKIITNSIEKLNKIIPLIKKDSKFQLGLKLDRSNVKKELKILYSIYNKKMYSILHTEYFNELQEFINNIKINDNDLSCPPIDSFDIKNGFINNINDPFLIINELDKFINETFKIIDPTNELPEFKLSLQTLRENILGRKLRISLIGNISVGKSTVLNCIIGEQILPTKETECTYRGVIIRHKNIPDFELYRTKLVSKGSGVNNYYYFMDDNKPYCKGIKNIKSYLKNKNSDKIIKNEDAYIVITGKLKIFDFIELNENLINKIEFIDLPGLDRKSNEFNNNKYYEKILKFSNICIYINEPKSINDKNSVNNMIEQYSNDKNKVFPNLRSNFSKTCLFLINKCDTLEKKKDKEKIINNVIKNFPVEEKITENNINIAFFSGQSFIEYLEKYNYFVDKIEKDPYYTLKSLYDEWDSKITYLKSFDYYINNRIANQIEEQFHLNLKELEVPSEFNKKIKNAINEIYKTNFRGMTNNEENKLIQTLYSIYMELKDKNFSDTNYSHYFFDILKNVIIFSEDLQNQNLNNAINQFFNNADDLFKKEIEKEDENQIKEKKKKCFFIKNELIPKINKLFKDKEKEIINLIDYGKYNCFKIFNDELQKIDSRLEQANNDVEKAAKILEEKIKKELESIKKEQDKKIKFIITEIENLIMENINKYYDNQRDLPKSEIDIHKGLTIKKSFSFITSAISNIVVRSGLILFGQSIIGGVAAGVSALGSTFSSALAGALLGPGGIAIGAGVGLIISVGTFIFHWFRKSKRYKDGIEDSRSKLESKLEEYKITFSNDFKILRESIIEEMNIKVEILSKIITSIDKAKWEELKNNYSIQKNIIKEKIKLKFNN